MDITIRKADRKDCAAMMSLVKELALFEKAPQQVTVSLAHFEESGFGFHPVYWAFVAESAGTIVAFALYYIRYSTWKGAQMYLEDLLVTETFRGKNIGSLLMNRLIEEARVKHLQGISWQVLNWNEPAIRFYEKFNARFDSEWINCSIQHPFSTVL